MRESLLVSFLVTFIATGFVILFSFDDSPERWKLIPCAAVAWFAAVFSWRHAFVHYKDRKLAPAAQMEPKEATPLSIGIWITGGGILFLLQIRELAVNFSIPLVPVMLITPGVIALAILVYAVRHGPILTFFSNFIHGTANKIDDITSMISTGRDSMNYVEGDHVLSIYIERLTAPPWNLIYANSIEQWLPPHDQEPIDAAERARILKKICKYFDDRRTSYTIAY